MRRVTFSRNYTLSLSRTCRCYCKYCSFATHQAHLYAPDEVEKLLDDAERRSAKELLVLTGGSFNPARSFGPAIVSGEWGPIGKWLLAYLLAPVLGAIAAAAAYATLFSTPGAKPPDSLEPVG